MHANPGAQMSSRTIARIAGPSLVALGISEAIHIDVFAGNPPAMVYLNGTLLLVGGVAILSNHHGFSRDWTVLVTLTGWILTLGGLYRMFVPTAPLLGPGLVTYGLLSGLTLVGAMLTLNGYRREPRGSPRS